jgi:hypothetical protein
MSTLLSVMTTQKSLTSTFVAMAVAERPFSLQVLWRFIAMTRDCIWHDQFYCKCFGIFAIIEEHGPVTLCGEGLVVSLHDVCGPNAAFRRLAQ